MRFGISERSRQGRFRDTSATVSAAGRAPSDPVGTRNPHLLAVGHEQENLFPPLRGPGGAVRFFAERKIKWWSSSRSGDAARLGTPTRNLASSQVACVNFLLPLIGVPGALRTLLRYFDDDVLDAAPIAHGTTSSPVEIEWVGVGAPLEGGRATRGAHCTSADALLVGDTTGGARRAYLFEWKYVEEYETEYLGDGRSGETRRSRYTHLYAAADGSFNGRVPLHEFLYEPFYQLMRLRLLADRMVRERELRITDARVVVMCPGANEAYRERITSPELRARFPSLKTVEDVMKAALRDPRGILFGTPEGAVTALSAAGLGDGLRGWLDYHRERYDY